jgi:hypothetical protein
MQETAARSTTCRPNAKTEALILSQVVHQVPISYPAPTAPASTTTFAGKKCRKVPAPLFNRKNPAGLRPPSSYCDARSGTRHLDRHHVLGLGQIEHEAGVEPACFGFKAQRGCRQPTARVLDKAAGIGPAWAAFRAQLGCQQPTPE